MAQITSSPPIFSNITFVNNGINYTLSRYPRSPFNMNRPQNGQVVFTYDDGTTVSKKYLGIDHFNDFAFKLIDNYHECPRIIGTPNNATEKRSTDIAVWLDNTNGPRYVVQLYNSGGALCPIIGIN